MQALANPPRMEVWYRRINVSNLLAQRWGCRFKSGRIGCIMCNFARNIGLRF